MHLCTWGRKVQQAIAIVGLGVGTSFDVRMVFDRRPVKGKVRQAGLSL